jgi:hypothetical protein
VKKRDLMTPEEMDALVDAHGTVYAAFELFDRWLAAWREAHPEDPRDDYELADVYAAMCGDDEIGEARP